MSRQSTLEAALTVILALLSIAATGFALWRDLRDETVGTNLQPRSKAGQAHESPLGVCTPDFGHYVPPRPTNPDRFLTLITPNAGSVVRRGQQVDVTFDTNRPPKVIMFVNVIGGAHNKAVLQVSTVRRMCGNRFSGSIVFPRTVVAGPYEIVLRLEEDVARGEGPYDSRSSVNLE